MSSLEQGGPLEHTVTLARGLARAGVQVSAVCASAGVAGRLEEAGARAHVVPLRHALDIGAARGMRRHLDGADVSHGQDRRSGLWVRLIAPSRPAARVYSVHGLPDPYLPPPVGRGRPGLRAAVAYRGLDAGLARRADAIITQSRALERALVQRLGWPAGRIVVIPNGVELGEPLQRRGSAIGTLSGLEPVKGLGVFLDAAATLVARRPELRFLLFGEGSESDSLRKRSALLGLERHVGFPGWVPTREALARLGVLVLPSHMENAPLVLLEAMAAGVPVVATRVGGVPELAPPGTARLVQAGDAGALARAVEQTLDDARGTAAQIAVARAHVERHGTAEAMVTSTLGLYAQLLGGRA